MPPIEDPRITRRTMIATAAASALIPAASIRCAAQNPNQPRSLTPVQRRTTEMLVDRIIPADELGPGALECGAANFIDFQLADYLAPEKDAWLAGLNALDVFAMQTQGAAFADLSADKRDAVLLGLTDNGAPANLQAFFNIARAYTMQGTFGDPHYGGNIGGKGWDIIRYPGARLATSADMQSMDKAAEPVHRSAWGNE